MKKTKKIKKLVLRGRRLKIVPEKIEAIFGLDEGNLCPVGKVIGAGPEAKCKVGDRVIFNTWGSDSAKVGEDTFYYVLDTDEFILEIL